MSAQPELFPYLNRWYSAKEHEIFLDLDSNRAIARALSVLRAAVTKKHLDVHQIWLYGTPTKGHAHLIIELKKDMDWMSRLAWSIWMGNDRLRVAYILERWNRGVPHQDLLIAKQDYDFRDADALCECEGKHKQPRITSRCPAMKKLLGGDADADYFTRTGKAPKRRKVRIPWGRILIKDLKRWRSRYE